MTFVRTSRAIEALSSDLHTSRTRELHLDPERASETPNTDGLFDTREIPADPALRSVLQVSSAREFRAVPQMALEATNREGFPSVRQVLSVNFILSSVLQVSSVREFPAVPQRLSRQQTTMVFPPHVSHFLRTQP